MKIRVWNLKNNLMLNEKQGQIVMRFDGRLRDCYTGPWTYENSEERNPDWPIMEFTGILDKNGKEIYEGDILAEEHDYDKDDICGDELTYIKHHVVCKGPGIFYHDEDNPHGLILNTYVGINTYVEVVGNIYENPELIEH